MMAMMMMRLYNHFTNQTTLAHATPTMMMAMMGRMVMGGRSMMMGRLPPSRV
jgi:hypothetical protein